MQGSSSQYTFSGHETFPFRYPWLKKGFDAVSADPALFSRDDAITTLGVGKNMVRSIRHWCLTAGILEPAAPGESSEAAAIRPTDLGRLLLADDGLDPYLEDPATLWLLHWQITTNQRRAATWFWTFSHFHEPEFTRDSLTTALTKWTDTLSGKKVAPSSLRRDVEVFIRTYVPSRQSKAGVFEDSLDCPLVEMGLISSIEGSQSFEFRRGPQESLPDGLLLFATLAFWDATAAASQTVSVADLMRLPGSPGRVFKIDEGSLALRYENIESWTDGAISYNETAGLKQLYRRKLVATLDALHFAYAVTEGAI